MILKRDDFIKIDVPILTMNEVNKNGRLYDSEVETKPQHEDDKLDAVRCAFYVNAQLLGGDEDEL